MKIVLGFASWIEDPDPPDRLSAAEIERLAEGALRLLERSLAEEQRRDAGR
jgi:hypothetical protein